MTETEPKREKIIKIRVSPEELATLQMHCTRGELARWMRETCLNPGQTDLVRDLRGSAPAADPELLRQLASIGNNLNQIARRVNTAEWGPAERVQVLAALAGIERELAGVRALHK
ncbi:MobC family plasmid mobilization relaxosome protein [Pseudomonas aeruginosa]|uniref:MobC family plasmid mobilization relaxosome protein n=1 Tax=Pseudomonas aeruginosa TaxID=287 RepID=UPI0005B55FD0|nr:MobC family plasmid mobilization relaxosome protein [Pseudomonas aeruginosa]RUJ07503.1 MobC family plasmid mobilization relaxosome protein [Pseudomonas aeruginosa]HEJ6181741.1 MobC family plasmid mobilization relaxosome protein [Pseudomonas aeruginosa]